MTPDRAAVAVLQQALDDRPGLDHEQTAVLAVTTLQALGWVPPRRRDTNAVQAWAAYTEAMRDQIAAEPAMQADYALTPQPEEQP